MRCHYEVYALSVYGSDVLEFDTVEEAIKEAKEWQTRTNNEVVVVKVTEEEINYV